jgi:bifunctional UDP-N-acetylglucosamine pyrophosphorylase/glucosamine-1-phosphate N-acetyltransferase
MLSTTALILAAGHGKRMGSNKSKVLHDVYGIPMLLHVYHSIATLTTTKPIVVVGSNLDEIKNVMSDSVEYVIQERPLGTGHAVMAAVPILKDRSEQVILMYGDMPLIHQSTISKLIGERERTGASIAMMSIFGDTSSTFGRVIRDDAGSVTEVIEWADAKQRKNATEILSTRELNAGLYCFNCQWLCDNVSKIVPRPSREYDEYYLTDIFRIAKEQDKLVIAIRASDNDEFFGISTTDDLVKADQIYQMRNLSSSSDHE